jgi:hypothetical protein
VEVAVVAERQELPDAKRAYEDALKACASAYDLKKEARLTEGTVASLQLQLDRAVAGDFGGDGGGDGGVVCGDGGGGDDGYRYHRVGHVDASSFLNA